MKLSMLNESFTTSSEQLLKFLLNSVFSIEFHLTKSCSERMAQGIVYSLGLSCLLWSAE